MICGDCGAGKHTACNGLLHTSLGFCACADRGHVEASQPPASQPCRQCPRTAWHLSGSDRSDGTRVYACADGHVVIVTTERVA